MREAGERSSGNMEIPQKYEGRPGRDGGSVPGANDIGEFISNLLNAGPLNRRLFLLRRQHPELAHEIDEIARAVREVADAIEARVRTGDAAPMPSKPVSVQASPADQTPRA
jgi:hypothetical protein